MVTGDLMDIQVIGIIFVREGKEIFSVGWKGKSMLLNDSRLRV